MFCLFSSRSKEEDTIFKNLITIQSHLFLSKNPGRVKNEQYYWKRVLVNGCEWYISFIPVKYKHEWSWAEIFYEQIKLNDIECKQMIFTVHELRANDIYSTRMRAKDIAKYIFSRFNKKGSRND